MSESKNLLKYFFESGYLKKQKHVGWWMAGVDNPETVAEHSWRAALIAYVIALREGVENPERIAVKTLFHDLHESRIGDIHSVAKPYLRGLKEAERQAERDQCKLLGRNGSKVLELLSEESEVAKDADYLEQAITAKEYLDIGHKSALDWIERVSKVLKTKTARELCEELKKTDSDSWWQGLKQDVSNLK
ncbi:HD family hydrolase [Candidatus Micrarchaeota archaeon]|nr:HD family hydrolase [Candidatus Micrarchaeota archaeon]